MTTARKKLLAAIVLLLCAGGLLLYAAMFRPVSPENAVRRAVFAKGHPISACLLTTTEATEEDFVEEAFEELSENQCLVKIVSHVPRTFVTRHALECWLVTETDGTYTATYRAPA